MNGWLPEGFPIPRLMSEYGVQAMPSYATLSDAYQMPQDADLYGSLNEFRQHHAANSGNREIENEIRNNLKMPNNTDPVRKFISIIYLSQINQAMHFKTAIELFRYI